MKNQFIETSIFSTSKEEEILIHVIFFLSVFFCLKNCVLQNYFSSAEQYDVRVRREKFKIRFSRK